MPDQIYNEFICCSSVMLVFNPLCVCACLHHTPWPYKNMLGQHQNAIRYAARSIHQYERDFIDVCHCESPVDFQSDWQRAWWESLFLRRTRLFLVVDCLLSIQCVCMCTFLGNARAKCVCLWRIGAKETQFAAPSVEWLDIILILCMRLIYMHAIGHFR